MTKEEAQKFYDEEIAPSPIVEMMKRKESSDESRNIRILDEALTELRRLKAENKEHQICRGRQAESARKAQIARSALRAENKRLKATILKDLDPKETK